MLKYRARRIKSENCSPKQDLSAPTQEDIKCEVPWSVWQVQAHLHTGVGNSSPAARWAGRAQSILRAHSLCHPLTCPPSAAPLQSPPGAGLPPPPSHHPESKSSPAAEKPPASPLPGSFRLPLQVFHRSWRSPAARGGDTPQQGPPTSPQ